MLDLVISVFRQALDAAATYANNIYLGGISLLQWLLGLLAMGFMIKAITQVFK